MRRPHASEQTNEPWPNVVQTAFTFLRTDGNVFQNALKNDFVIFLHSLGVPQDAVCSGQFRTL